MRILIMGVTGMLGSALHQVLAQDSRFEVWGSMRDPAGRRFFSPEHHNRLIADVEVADPNTLTALMKNARPEVLINAIGVVKQLAAANDPLAVVPINSLLPHRLAALCDLEGARLVHISTDCVFSGRTGNYRESDVGDAEDLYGLSKYIGEVRDKRHVVTLRTSGIGHELTTRHGLVEWFLSQEGPVKGYTRAIYSGLPWVELGRVIANHVLPRPDLYGLYHVSSEPVAKFDLLRLIADTYRKKIEIVPDCTVQIDRSLDSSVFRSETGWMSPSWKTLVETMYAHRTRVPPAHA